MQHPTKRRTRPLNLDWDFEGGLSYSFLFGQEKKKANNDINNELKALYIHGITDFLRNIA
jgi:hypothetical protein